MSYYGESDSEKYARWADEAIAERNRDAEDIATINRLITERGPRWVIDVFYGAIIGRVASSDVEALKGALKVFHGFFPEWFRFSDDEY